MISAVCWCAGGVDPDRCGGADLPAAMGVEPAALRRWLATRSGDLSLELRLTAGGGEDARGWLGLCARGPTETQALRSLAAAKDDLGEALDVWGWWPEPEAPPPLPALQRALQPVDPVGVVSLRSIEAAPRWIEAMLAMSPARLPARTARLRLRSIASSAALRADVETVVSQAVFGSPDLWDRAVPEREADELRRLRRIVEQTELAELEFSLHGERPLGAVLAEGMLHRFIEALHCAGLRFDAAPPRPLRIDAEVFEWSLQALQVGATDDDEDDEPLRLPVRRGAELSRHGATTLVGGPRR